jgi:predicted nuclease of predicted toxin-antitoxin system
LTSTCLRTVALGFRRRGIDVTTTPEAGILGASDEEQLAHASREGRVVVTRDDDFLALAAKGVSHAGIVFTRQARRNIGPTVLALTLLHRVFAAEDLVGRVEYL